MNPATYCKKCGAYIPDGKEKCIACGFPADVPLALPKNDDFETLQTTTIDDTTVQVASCNGLSSEIIPRDYYKPVLDASENFWSEQKQQEPKPDIDLDDLMGKTFFKVKLDGKVSKFYFGSLPEIQINESEIFGRTIDGSMIRCAIKRTIYLCLIEG